MKNIIVYDAIMGSGKTYDAIERMKTYVNEKKKFIYITPFLSEIARIKEALPKKSINVPLSFGEGNIIDVEIIDELIIEEGLIDLNGEKKFKRLNKRAQFLKFVSQGENVITTHALFKSLKKEDYSLFKDYILILDEVVDPLELRYIGERDIEILVEQNLIIIDEKTNQVRFIDEDYKGRFEDVKKLCSSITVFYLDKCFFAWIFPIEIFKSFKEIQVLTYLFKGSLLCAYLKLFEIDYYIESNDEPRRLKEIKSLLNIYEGRANESKQSLKSYSKTWCCGISKRIAKKEASKFSNLIKRNFETPSKYNAFTTFKDCKSKFSGDRYARGFIPVNARATNDFKDIKTMAYLANRYFSPQQINFFRERGIVLNEELWALSELIQWIWRGCIREKKPMNLYIPSSRMRDLLTRWLNGEFIETKSVISINEKVA